MKLRLLPRLALACTLLAVASLPAMAQSPAESAEIQRYSRKYISFFYPQNFPLNNKLAEAFQADFPRFDYHLASNALNLDLMQFLRQVQSLQRERAGELAAGRGQEDARFGDTVVSWSETQRIAKAAYVFVPRWTFEKIELDGPYPSNSRKPESAAWNLHAENRVKLEMGLYNLEGRQPQRYETVDNSWSVTRKDVMSIPFSDIQAAAARASTPEDPIDLSKSLSSSERERVFKALRQNAALNRLMQQVEAQNPYVYMMNSAVKSIGYGGVISSVQRLEAFLIRAEVAEADMQRDRVKISLGEGESVSSLGIDRDASYKIMEYVQGEDPREIGWVKVRDRAEDHVFSQPIIVGRDFELGDQVVEYPKAGFGINLRGGLSSNGDILGGGGALDLDFNIGPAFDVSELYFSLTGGYYNGLILGELGLQQKWYMRQLIFALAGRAGGAFGEDDAGGGVTGLLGLHWQATPEFVIGLDGGWRFYSNLNGPLLEAFIRFDL